MMMNFWLVHSQYFDDGELLKLQSFFSFFFSNSKKQKYKQSKLNSSLDVCEKKNACQINNELLLSASVLLCGIKF